MRASSPVSKTVSETSFLVQRSLDVRCRLDFGYSFDTRKEYVWFWTFAFGKTKRLAIAALILRGIGLCQAQQTPRSARDYYNELKTANSFNRYKDTFVCFSDDDNPGFAVISRGSDVINEMKKAGVSPEKTILQWKNLLFVETYYKGVSNEAQVYGPLGNDGTQWSIEFSSPLHGRIIYSINWATGRYRMSMYALDLSKAVPAKQVFGKCELIHTVK